MVGRKRHHPCGLGEVILFWVPGTGRLARSAVQFSFRGRGTRDEETTSARSNPEQKARGSAQGGRRHAPGPAQASPLCWRLQSKAALPRAICTTTSTKQTDSQRNSSSKGGLRSRRICGDPDVVVGGSLPSSPNPKL